MGKLRKNADRTFTSGCASRSCIPRATRESSPRASSDLPNGPTIGRTRATRGYLNEVKFVFGVGKLSAVFALFAEAALPEETASGRVYPHSTRGLTKQKDVSVTRCRQARTCLETGCARQVRNEFVSRHSEPNVFSACLRIRLKPLANILLICTIPAGVCARPSTSPASRSGAPTEPSEVEL